MQKLELARDQMLLQPLKQKPDLFQFHRFKKKRFG